MNFVEHGSLCKVEMMIASGRGAMVSFDFVWVEYILPCSSFAIEIDQLSQNIYNHNI